MPTRPRPRLASPLLLLAGLAPACSAEEFAAWEPPPQTPSICELEDLSASDGASGLLRPTADFRVHCGRLDHIATMTAAIGEQGLFVAAQPSGSYHGDSHLYHITQASQAEAAIVSDLPLPLETGDWMQLVVDDGGRVHLYAQGEQHAWRVPLLEQDAEPETELFEAQYLDRLELIGDQPHLWIDREFHVTRTQFGAWIETPALVVEDYAHRLTSLDGVGSQISYAFDYYELMAFDGETTTLVGSSFWPTWDLIAVPTGHPVAPTHEHTIVTATPAGVRLWWPRRLEANTIDIPVSPSYPAEIDGCLVANAASATRTADGRVWLAWVATTFDTDCADDPAVLAEAGSLRLVEVDPVLSLAREVMRVPIDLDAISPSEGVGAIWHNVKLSIGSFEQQVVIVVADGPLRVLQIDTTELD